LPKILERLGDCRLPAVGGTVRSPNFFAQRSSQALQVFPFLTGAVGRGVPKSIPTLKPGYKNSDEDRHNRANTLHPSRRGWV
jgi:hypothetical protein